MLDSSSSFPIDPLLAVRAFLVFLFGISGTQKRFSQVRFREIVTAYAVVEPRFVGLLAAMITVLELAVAIFLTVGPYVRAASAGALLLLLLFATAMTTNLIRGRQWIDCGCFGATSTRISWNLVIRNIALAALAAPILFSNSGSIAEPLRASLSTLCGMAGVLWIVVVTHLVDLSSMAHPHKDKGAN
jgi:hypothetical protein